MRLKTIFTTACCVMALAGAVTFTACQKDPCIGLTCQNGGSCDEGFCTCQTGFEGVECQTKTADKFVGTFIGHLHCDGAPGVVDTVDIVLVGEPDQIKISRRGLMGAGAGMSVTGTVVGNDVMIPDINTGSSRRSITAYLDPSIGKLTMYDKVMVDTSDAAATSKCTFYGFKQ